MRTEPRKHAPNPNATHRGRRRANRGSREATTSHRTQPHNNNTNRSPRAPEANTTPQRPHNTNPNNTTPNHPQQQPRAHTTTPPSQGPKAHTRPQKTPQPHNTKGRSRASLHRLRCRIVPVQIYIRPIHRDRSAGERGRRDSRATEPEPPAAKGSHGSRHARHKQAARGTQRDQGEPRDREAGRQ